MFEIHEKYMEASARLMPLGIIKSVKEIKESTYNFLVEIDGSKHGHQKVRIYRVYIVIPKR